MAASLVIATPSGAGALTVSDQVTVVAIAEALLGGT